MCSHYSVEALRMVISSCASNRSGAEPCNGLSFDVKGAYCVGKAKGPIYIEMLLECSRVGDEDGF